MVSARLLAAALLVGLSVAACGDSGYEYVKNSDHGLFFKIPEDWSAIRLRVEDRSEAVFPDRPWVMLVDSAPNPSVAHADQDLPTHPVGEARIESVLRRRDEVSFAFLRSLALGGQADPLELAREGEDDVEIIEYEDVTTQDGFRGERVAFSIHIGEGRYLTIDQVAVVDTETTTLYRLTIKCEARCYRQHRGDIDDVIGSWTVEERS